MYDIDIVFPVLWSELLTPLVWVLGLLAVYRLVRWVYGLIPTS